MPNYNLSTLRIFGVLQRVALGYIVVALVVIFVPALNFDKTKTNTQAQQAAADDDEESQLGDTSSSAELVDITPQVFAAKLRNLATACTEPRSYFTIWLKYIVHWLIGTAIVLVYAILIYLVAVPGCPQRGLTTPTYVSQHTCFFFF